MSRVAYVNGRYVQHREATVHIEDRGYQFADGVYEVVAIHRRTFVDEVPHLDRLDRSLSELRIAAPMPRSALRVAMRELVRRNGIAEGIVYMQVTRGVARRDHPFPADSKTSLVMTASRRRPPDPGILETGVRAVTVPDIRWGRCDIKTVGLLPNVLAKQQARESGAYEAWLVADDGTVTEGSSTNAWILTREGKLVTRPTGNDILSGITRASVLALVRQHGIELVERPFTLDEALTAREAFVTSATSYVTPVVQIDQSVIGNGKPGSMARQLWQNYLEYMEGAGATH